MIASRLKTNRPIDLGRESPGRSVNCASLTNASLPILVTYAFSSLLNRQAQFLHGAKIWRIFFIDWLRRPMIVAKERSEAPVLRNSPHQPSWISGGSSGFINDAPPSA
jgi:hypothetical protein